MSNDFGNQSYIPSNYLDDYQETISEDQLHHGQGSSSRPWAALRRGNSRASFQERTSLPNDLQFSMPKHRSFGGLETIRAGAVPEAQSTPAWPSSASPSNHSRDPSSPIATRYQTLSARSSQGQSFSQGEDSSSQPFTDSLYENLTAMLTPGWEGSLASGSNTDIDFDHHLSRSSQRTPPPTTGSSSDLISPSRVIRNPRDLISPRRASIHDPYSSSTFSKLDFRDEIQDGGSLEQGSNQPLDAFNDSAMSSSWAGPTYPTSSGMADHWGSFRDRSFSTTNSEVDMDWDADLSMEDNRSPSPAVSMSPSSISGVLIPGSSQADFMQSLSPTDMLPASSRLHRLPEENSGSVTGSSSQGHSGSYRSPSSLSLRSNRGIGGGSGPGSSRPLSPSQQLQMSTSSLDSPSFRRRGAVSPTATAPPSNIGQRRRTGARSSGALRSGPGPIRPTTASSSSVSSGPPSASSRTRAGTVSNIYMNSASSTGFSMSPHTQDTRTSSLDGANNFNRTLQRIERPSSRASLGDGRQFIERERPRSQVQPYTLLPGEGGLSASLSSELASLGLDPSQLRDEDIDLSDLIANASRAGSSAMITGGSSGSGSGGQQRAAGDSSFGWDDNSFNSTSNTSSQGMTAQDDSLLSSGMGSRSFGPMGRDTPLSSPASSPFNSRETSFASMHPLGKSGLDSGPVSDFGELEESMLESSNDRSSTWPRVRSPGSHQGGLQAPPMHQTRSSNAVQMLGPSSSKRNQQESQQRLADAVASVTGNYKQERRGSGSFGGHQRGNSSASPAVEPRNSASDSGSSRWSMIDASSAASAAAQRGSSIRNSLGRGSEKRMASTSKDLRMNASSSSEVYRSPVHEVLASPNAAELVEEAARRERNSRVKYSEVSAALETLRLFLRQREHNLQQNPDLGPPSTTSTLRSAPSTSEISVASTSASVASSSSRTQPARTLRHPPRGPLPPRGSISSSSSSSHTQVGANVSSSELSFPSRNASSPNHLSVVSDLSERVTRLRQRSAQFSQQNLREAYRTSSDQDRPNI